MTAQRRYDATAARASRAVLRTYSTSFGIGTRLLPPRSRADIEAVYALVRLADEVVDTLPRPGRGRGARRARGADVARAGHRVLDQRRRARVRARRAPHRHRARRGRPVLRLDARRPVGARARPRVVRRATSTAPPRSSGVMCLKVFLVGRPAPRRPGRASRRPRPSPGRGRWAPRSRRSTSCATSARTTATSGGRTCPGVDADSLSRQRRAPGARGGPRRPGRPRAPRCRSCRRAPAAPWRRRPRCTTGCSTTSRPRRRRTSRTAACACPGPVKAVVVGPRRRRRARTRGHGARPSRGRRDERAHGRRPRA